MASGPGRRKRHVGDAVVAAGERRPAVRHAPHHEAESDGNEDEIHAPRAHGKAEEQCKQRPGGDARRRGEQGGHGVAHLQNGHGVGRDGKEGGVGEREQSRMSEKQIDREREQAEDADERRKAGPVRPGDVRQSEHCTE
jgi:hypothetical protein